MSWLRRWARWGGKERRREERREAPHLSIDSLALEVALRDTSDSGLGIETERPLKLGVTYPFKLCRNGEMSEVYGLVRWCRIAGRDRFHAGVTVGKTIGSPVSQLAISP